MNPQFGENKNALSEEGGGGNLVHPITREVGFGLSSYELHMKNLKSVEAYNNDLGARSYIKPFISLNGKKPNNKESREHLDFYGHSRTNNGHFLLVDNEEKMVRKD